MPYGILRRADVADVIALATESGPMTLYPASKVEPQATVAEFDARHSEGADYVIVPAISRDDDPAVLHGSEARRPRCDHRRRLRRSKVVGAAGLLDGKRATTHWYFVRELRDEHPTMSYVPDRRLVVDRGVATTTGVTASMPIFAHLIEAIAGREKANAVALDLGLAQWDARHDSDAFTLTRPFALTAAGSTLAFWNREKLGLAVARGVDEVSLALVADAWSRTYRSRAVVLADSAKVETRSGILILPDQVDTSWPEERLLPPVAESATGKGPGPGASRNRRTLWSAHRRSRRQATRIPDARRVILKE